MIAPFLDETHRATLEKKNDFASAAPRICEDDEAAHGQQFGLAAIKRVRSERRSNVHPFVEILRPGR
jgi:hypothetical protein